MRNAAESRGGEPALIERKFPPGKRLRKTLCRVAASLGYHSKPAFMIIGAQKAGTTGLFSMLSKHRQILHPMDKELHYFDGAKIPYGNENEYHSYFPLPFMLHGGKLTYEATPTYLHKPFCAERIYRYSPEIKLIAILREPIARAYSSWNMYRAFRDTENPYYSRFADPRSFEEAVEEELALLDDSKPEQGRAYLSRGFYADQLAQYYRWFPKEQLLVLNYAQLRDDPQVCVKRVCDFLGIDADVELPVRYANKSTYEEGILPETIERLEPVFAPKNAQLFELIGEDFGW